MFTSQSEKKSYLGHKALKFSSKSIKSTGQSDISVLSDLTSLNQSNHVRINDVSSNRSIQSHSIVKYDNSDDENVVRSYDLPRVEYVFDFDKLPYKIPYIKFFEDMLCRSTNFIDLSYWKISNIDCKTIAQDCQRIQGLILDYSIGLTSYNLSYLQSLSNINRLSIRKTLYVTDDVMRSIMKLPQLYELDISENRIDSNSLKLLSESCECLKSLSCQHIQGLNDNGLSHLAQCITTYQSLHKLILDYCLEFTDQGFLTLLDAGLHVITHLSIIGCTNITNLGLTGFRSKNILDYLNISSLKHQIHGISKLQWISEGCHQLRELICIDNIDICDLDMKLLGHRCIHLKKLNITNCINITNDGISSFFYRYKGLLASLDMSGCVGCTDLSIMALANYEHVDNM